MLQVKPSAAKKKKKLQNTRMQSYCKESGQPWQHRAEGDAPSPAVMVLCASFFVYVHTCVSCSLISISVIILYLCFMIYLFHFVLHLGRLLLDLYRIHSGKSLNTNVKNNRQQGCQYVWSYYHFLNCFGFIFCRHFPSLVFRLEEFL